jgi:chemotaxis protein methyltransferase CheR
VAARPAAGRNSGARAPADAGSTLTPAQLTVTPALFRKFQKLVYSETGIWLGSSKTALLCGRLYRRVMTLGISTLEQYFECVSAPEGQEEFGRMIDALTTNETRFFREPKQFDFLVERLIPQWQRHAAEGRRSKRVRIWSAGCSSGEEPYSIAMLLAKYLQAEDGWDVRLLATDISNRVLEKACKGIYDLERSKDIPKDLLRRFMLRGFNDCQGQMKVQVGIQQMVEFRYLNLSQPYVVQGPYDLILCRNVLIYFDTASKRKVVANLVSHLAAGGFLFVGHAENLASLSQRMKSIEPSIYAMKDDKAEAGTHLISDDPEGGNAIGASAGR